MGIMVDPVSEFSDALDHLERLVAALGKASQALANVPESEHKAAANSEIQSAVSISGQLFENLREAREKLSRRFW
jgi:hypothetical protein